MPVVVGVLSIAYSRFSLSGILAPLRILAHQLVKPRDTSRPTGNPRPAKQCTSAPLRSYCAVVPLASAVPAIAGSYCTSFALGYAACTAFHCRASVGEVMVALRK